MNYEATPVLKGNILIVDDVPNNLHLLAKILSRHGYKTRTAPDGQLALRSIESTPPDLILLDIMMPSIDGYKVCEILKASATTKDIPVIFISALNEVLDKVKAFEVGGVDYITKPFQEQEVLARVSNQLLQRQLLQQTQSYAQQLEETLTELKKTQSQLIQKEKMASLGQLAAGIAHEINNPVNFISGNITMAADYAQDLVRLIKLYRHYYPHPVAEIVGELEKIQPEFIADDYPKLLSSMKEGTSRISEIVLSFRNFSRLGQEKCKPVDIHEGIDNTLVILQHRLKGANNIGEIEVRKHYSKLPKITCYASLLNQVFMNLLINAIDALESQPYPRKITISTSVSSDSEPALYNPNSNLATQKFQSVMILIADNGCGICEAVRHRIFDPFFTTKPVGRGTGLGLAISHDIIVEKHGGKISCISAPGGGTEFILQIPISVIAVDS
ncbi:MAG: hybrid sensor histidine kinase/response regulator [Oscillatoriales cyanobacterium]|nr:MAG: hybrid sensor histidine kinase/response regulator [Oscillatoriales cyanobacterium]